MDQNYLQLLAYILELLENPKVNFIGFAAGSLCAIYPDYSFHTAFATAILYLLRYPCIKWLQGCEEITVIRLMMVLKTIEREERRTLKLFAQEGERLQELCNTVQNIVPTSFLDQFPNTDEKQNQLARVNKVYLEPGLLMYYNSARPQNGSS